MFIIFQDLFQRANNPNTLGNGWQTWDPGCIYGILNNSAVLEQVGLDFSAVTFQDKGQSDTTVEIQSTNAHLQSGQFTSDIQLALRCKDIGSYVELKTLQGTIANTVSLTLSLLLNDGAGFGNIIAQYAVNNVPVSNASTFTKLKCTMKRSIYTAFLDGIQVWQVDTTQSQFLVFGNWGNQFQANTKHGFTVGGGNPQVPGVALGFTIFGPDLGPGRAIEIPPQPGVANGRVLVKVFRGNLFSHERLVYVANWNGDASKLCAPYGDQWYPAIIDTDGILKIDISQPGQFQDGI